MPSFSRNALLASTVPMQLELDFSSRPERSFKPKALLTIAEACGYFSILNRTFSAARLRRVRSPAIALAIWTHSSRVPRTSKLP